MTELFDENGKIESKIDYTAKTTGWVIRQAVRVNSISGICLTKLDVLDTFKKIQVCVIIRIEAYI